MGHGLRRLFVVSIMRHPTRTTRVAGLVHGKFAAGDTCVDTGGELSGMARTLRFAVAETDARMRVLGIRHQCQCWVWAFMDYTGRSVV